MSFLSSVQAGLHFADNAIQDGKVNLVVQDPVVKISGQEAVRFAQPYIIAVVAILFVGLMVLLQRKG